MKTVKKAIKFCGSTVFANSRGQLIPILGLALASLLCAAPANAAGNSLAAYVGNPNASSSAGESSFEADFNSFVTTMSVKPTYIDAYVDYRQPVSAWPNNASWQAWSNASSPDAKQLIPIIGLPMASIAAGAATADAQYRAFAAGKYDTFIQGVILGWVNQGFKTLFVRPGWEMNIPGPTYVGNTSQSQADWVVAFQHIVRVMRQTAAQTGAQVWTVWNPGAINYSNANATASLYPGDNFVDIVGIDIYGDMYPYSDSSSAKLYHDWDTGREDTSVAQFIADPVNRAHYWTYPAATEWSLDSSGGHCMSLGMLTQFALQHHKRIAIPEAGAGNSNAGTDILDDPTFPQWLSQQLQAVEKAGGIISFVGIWDSNGGGNYMFSDPSNEKPQEAAAWADYFGGAAPQ